MDTCHFKGTVPLYSTNIGLLSNRVECMSQSNKTLFYLLVEVYLHLLPKVQLHVSAVDNSHLQVVHEPLDSF